MQVIFDNADSLFKREWILDQALNMMNVNFFLPEGGFDDVVIFFLISFLESSFFI